MKTIDTCDKSRRKLLKKVYSTPVVAVLGTMSLKSSAEAMGKKVESTSSTAGDYGRNDYQEHTQHHNKYGSSSLHEDNGWGNGDDSAPGNSGRNNNAENDYDGRNHRNHGESHYN